ncbi:2-amino-4-oxopentanoate thiolase subunit OrtA [Pelosinus propionicus]|uniref:2-amino-4-ketopentanoate thiolase alpha subunit n=1 Tax=Pelosinus propionicus DSM 13327 TaxID=1123291 RepID=A0A1I4JLL9_9FIRM|nr:2-amino-4-oxopentanoate thiolase subunit OrtA [Pelosinus propionicus]SFL67469.1 hypothetical protein SAMN04490355_10138 [Pelosinus propionicus DSM 13327]
MSQAQKGDWVQIYQIILPAGKRAPQVPAETASVPLEMWVKGFLEEEQAQVGTDVTICSLAGRLLRGRLIAKNPHYEVNYGFPQPELLTIGAELKAILEGNIDE